MHHEHRNMPLDGSIPTPCSSSLGSQLCMFGCSCLQVLPHGRRPCLRHCMGICRWRNAHASGACQGRQCHATRSRHACMLRRCHCTGHRLLQACGASHVNACTFTLMYHCCLYHVASCWSQTACMPGLVASAASMKSHLRSHLPLSAAASAEWRLCECAAGCNSRG